MSDTRLCDVCSKLNIERLSSPEGYVHHTISDLKDAALQCRLCKLLIGELRSSKRTPITFRHRLRNAHITRGMKVCLKLTEEKNSISVEVTQTGDDDVIARVALQVWTTEEDAALAHGLPWRRQPGSNTSSTAALRIAKEWLSNCIKHHAQNSMCRFDPHLSRYRGAEMPTRLIDLSRGFDDLRLVPGTASNQPYAALSYVWGVSEAPWKTVQGNVHRRQSGFAITELPKSLRDAIIVTAALRLHLCWIDAIYIIQNDVNEWVRESVKMDVVYSSSAVTLMASCSASNTEGLFNAQSTTCDDFETRGIAVNSISTSGVCSTLYISPPAQHAQELEIFLFSETRDTTLSERAWCFQEWIMSPRKLYFSSSQLFWECSRGTLSEDGLWTYQRHHRGLTQALMSYVEGRGPTNEKMKSWSMSMNMLWYHDSVSQAYSDRKVTNQADRLIAIAGLAKMMQLAVPSQYLAGIWGHSLPGALCWRRVAAGAKCSQYVAPSWSWASQDSIVEYMLDALDPSKRCISCKILDTSVKTQGGDEMGLVVEGSITLRAPAFDGRIREILTRSGDSTKYIPALFPTFEITGGHSSALPTKCMTGLVMDDENEESDLAVTAIIVYDQREEAQTGLLIVKPSRNLGFERVGFLWTESPGDHDIRPRLNITTRTSKIV